MQSFSIKHWVCILLVAFSCVRQTYAKDFGQQATTFGIKEEGFVAMIKRKLKSFDLNAEQQKMQDITREKVSQPKPVAGIKQATETKSYIFDPSYELDQDIYLPDGKLLYAKGTKVNPLDHMEYPGKLVFIDGSNKAQVAWAKKHHIKAGGAQEINNLDTSEDESKIILVAGKPLELEAEMGVNIYFDQFGELTTKFKIAHVPAVVVQAGRALKVTEINIEE